MDKRNLFRYFSGGDKKSITYSKKNVYNWFNYYRFIIHIRGATKIQNGDLTFINEKKDSDNLLETILAVKSYVPKHSFVRRGLYIIKKPKAIIIEWD
jgi:hypothetical protein